MKKEPRVFNKATGKHQKKAPTMDTTKWWGDAIMNSVVGGKDAETLGTKSGDADKARRKK